MKYLKKFEQLIESYSICRKYGIKNYTIKNGIVDVEGNVDLSGIGLTHLPLKFGKVTGNFDCSRNQLTSLEGSPIEVGGNFDCHKNQLTTLVGGPERVIGGFDCSENQLISLEGAPDCDYLYCNENLVYIIWILFNHDKRFIEKLNGMYNGSFSPFVIKDGHNYLRGDILEEIADELGITLPEGWQDEVEEGGYTII
jgi:hypothetical protein